MARAGIGMIAAAFALVACSLDPGREDAPENSGLRIEIEKVLLRRFSGPRAWPALRALTDRPGSGPRSQALRGRNAASFSTRHPERP